MAINIVPEQYGLLTQAQPQPAAQPAQQGGFLNSLGNMFSGGGGTMTPQQQMMLSLGAGMLANSRRRPAEAFGAAVPQAMQQQMLAQKLFDDDEEKKRKERARQALGQFITSPGFQNQVPEGYRQAFGEVAQTDPEMAWQLYGTLNKQGEIPAKIQWAQWAMSQSPEKIKQMKEMGLLDGNGNVKVQLNNGQLSITPEGVYAPDPNSPTGFKFTPHPGTKGAADVQSAEIEAANAERASKAKDFNEAFRSGIAGQKVQRIRQILKDPANRAAVSGYRGRVGQSINPTGVAGEYARTLDTLKAGQGFRELQTMRAENKTGGALGQVTERELAFLQQTLGTLDPTASPEEIERTMDNIEAQYQSILSKLDYNDPNIGKVLSLLGVGEIGASSSAPTAPIQTEDGFTIEVQ